MLNLTEIENLEARFIREFGIKNLSYIVDLETWARDGLHLMRIPNFYTIKDIDLKIVNGSARLRCNSDMLIAAYYYNCEPSNFNINSAYELHNRNGNSLGSLGLPTCGNMYVSISGGNLYIKNQTGYVKLFFKDIPTNCDGKTLVPTNSMVQTALMYYFIYRMSLSGYQHPLIDWSTAKQLWEKEYPAAGNDASWFTEAELQEFTELWTNPLIGDLHRNNYIH